MTIFSSRSSLEVSAEPASSPPPPVQEVFNAASGVTAAVRDDVAALVDRLVDANVALDDVVLRATSQIDQLRELVEASIARREANIQTIKCLESAGKSGSNS